MSLSEFMARPIATNAPSNECKMISLDYNRQSDFAWALYEDGHVVEFPECRASYNYGLCLIISVNENVTDGFDMAFMTMDEDEVDMCARLLAYDPLPLHACRGLADSILAASGDEEMTESVNSTTNRALKGKIVRSYRSIGIPGSFRRMGHWILPHLNLLESRQLYDLLPGRITRDLVERLHATDFVFRNSSLLRI